MGTTSESHPDPEVIQVRWASEDDRRRMVSTIAVRAASSHFICF